MAVVCDKWVALKIVEFLMCVGCLVGKRVSSDDEARLALLRQKFSREWSLLTSVTWDNVGGAFADAVYGGYTIITFGLLIGRIFQEIPKGRRILEGVYLGLGLLLFLVLGGLELASLDSIPGNLITNAAVLGSFSLIVAALFLIDLMAPRIYTATHHSQTDAISSPKIDKKVTIAPQPVNGPSLGNGQMVNEKSNGHVIVERPKDLDLSKTNNKKETTLMIDSPNGYTKFDDAIERDLEKSKFGSLRSEFDYGNYIRLEPPEHFKLHYERELSKFNEKYYKEYLDSIEERLSVKEDYLPEPQTPVFAKVKSGRLSSLYDDMSPTYEHRRQSKSPSRVKTVSPPTLQQLEDYLRASTRSRRSETPALFPMEPIEEKDREGTDIDGRTSATPSDRGYVQYAAGKWPDKRELKTPRHSPT